MSGFMGIGGSSQKTDRSNQLVSFSGLKNLFNWGLPTAQAGITAGTGDLSKSAGYYRSLLGGNRPAVSAAVAPETAAVQSASDASRRQAAASGTARGGGVAGEAQQSKDATMAKVQNLMFGVRPAAAEGLAKTGTAEAGIGANILGTSAISAANLGELAGTSRNASMQQQNQLGAAAGELYAALLFG